jgi:hypothetical protein
VTCAGTTSTTVIHADGTTMRVSTKNGDAAAAAAAAAAALPRLVLHFDVNETIMVGDPAAGIDFGQCLNVILSKSAAVRPAAEDGGQGGGEARGRWSGWTWHDGSPLDPAQRTDGVEPPPLLPVWRLPDGCRFFKDYSLPKEITRFAKTFTEPGSPGEIYRPVYDRMEAALRCPAAVAADKRLSHDGTHHFLLPAFFRTLSTLHDRGRSFTVVIRTFGTDGPAVAEALRAFSEGCHTFGAVPGLGASLGAAPLWVGRYRSQDGAFTLTAADKHLAGAPDFSGLEYAERRACDHGSFKASPHVVLSSVCLTAAVARWRESCESGRAG